jgi:undecaprenyl-diphosphatase
MTWVQALILGIVEGLTEFLPVSSTGHLILASSLIGLEGEAVDRYLVVIQLGAILSVLTLYRTYAISMIMGLLGRDRDGAKLLLKLFVAFLPAAVLGVLLKSTIEAMLFRPGPVIAALLLGGVVMIIVEKLLPAPGSVGETQLKRIEDVTLVDSVLIGCVQCLAMWPGTSRSMATILGARIRGLQPAAAAEFSFLLALPTLGGATALTIAKDWKAFAEMKDGLQLVLFGNAVAFVVAFLAVRWFVHFVSARGMAPFGYYRIALGLFFLYAIKQGWVSF